MFTKILMLILIVGNLQVAASWSSVFNLTSAVCFQQDKTLIEEDRSWIVPNRGSYAAGTCHDSDGIGYRYGYTAYSCNGCIRYRCSYKGVHVDGVLHYHMFWAKNSISSNCCQDCKGTIYPPDEVISVTVQEDECRTEVKEICKHSDIHSRSMGTIIMTSASYNCCADGVGLHKAGYSKLEATSCSNVTCVEGTPSYWTKMSLFPGVCSCCEFNGTLIPDGEVVTVEQNQTAKCCEGNLVMQYEPLPIGESCDVPQDCDDARLACANCETACQAMARICPVGTDVLARTLEEERECQEARRRCDRDMRRCRRADCAETTASLTTAAETTTTE